jgi:hypothetical protein
MDRWFNEYGIHMMVPTYDEMF